MTVKEYKKIAYGEWFDYVDPADAKRAHARNVQRCHAAIKKHEAKDRKLNILLVHGSGRSSFKSLAHEFSNSQFLLKSAVRQFDSGTIIFLHAIAVIRRPALSVASLVIAFRWTPCRSFIRLYCVATSCSALLASISLRCRVA